MKNILSYTDFLLEAKIKFSDRFRKTISRIEGNPMSDALLDVENKEVDVNTNYIDIDDEKSGFVKFVPNDKVAKEGESLRGKVAMTNQPGAHYDTMSKKLLGDGYREPTRGQRGIVEREISEDEAFGVSGFTWDFVYPQSSLVVFMWRDSQGEGRCVFDKRNLELDYKAATPVSAKFGKIAGSLISKQFGSPDPDQLEDLVRKYKSINQQRKGDFSRLKIVSGEEIRKWYLHSNYSQNKGTLGKSCMKYEFCSKYLDIYVENSSVVSMIIMMDGDKISARALLWTDSKGRKIMDRVYTVDSSDEMLFIDFAKSMSFWYKKNQDNEESGPFIDPKGNETEEEVFLIKLERGGFKTWPYIDTFKFYSIDDETLSNSKTGKWDYELSQVDGTNGDCEDCGGMGMIDCPACSANGFENCEDCEATGSVTCGLCDGDGEEVCGYCDGRGEDECALCDGSGKSEDGEECEECGGNGKEICEHCSGEGSRDCGRCDGEGIVECMECNNGRTECRECHGDAEIPCPECH